VKWLGLDRATRQFVPTRRIRFALAQEALERFAAGRPIRVLDAGCSEGLFSEALARRHRDWSIDAVDFDERVIEQARLSLREAGVENVSTRVADVTSDLPEREYDAICALELLTLVDDDEATVASLARALKPGGLLVGHVKEKHWQPVISKRTTWTGELRHGYSDSEIRALLERPGLVRVSVRPTARKLAQLGHEVAESHPMYRAGLAGRVVWFPFAVAAAALDQRGVTWGAETGYLFEANKI
jgi:trans-aconitate methyltransferase